MVNGKWVHRLYRPMWFALRQDVTFHSTAWSGLVLTKNWLIRPTTVRPYCLQRIPIYWWWNNSFHVRVLTKTTNDLLMRRNVRPINTCKKSLKERLVLWSFNPLGILHTERPMGLTCSSRCVKIIRGKPGSLLRCSPLVHKRGPVATS